MEFIESYEFEGGNNYPMTIYTKGQIEPEIFIRTYKEKYGVTLNEDDVKQMIIRFVPLGQGTNDYYWMKSKAGRGAFWITYIDIYELMFPLEIGVKARRWRVE